MNNSVR